MGFNKGFVCCVFRLGSKKTSALVVIVIKLFVESAHITHQVESTVAVFTE